MKTILTRTALAVLAVASLGFAACSAGVEATPQDASINNGGSQSAPVQTNSPASQQSESSDDTAGRRQGRVRWRDRSGCHGGFRWGVGSGCHGGSRWCDRSGRHGGSR